MVYMYTAQSLWTSWLEVSSYRSRSSYSYVFTCMHQKLIVNIMHLHATYREVDTDTEMLACECESHSHQIPMGPID